MTQEDIIRMAQACWPSDRRMWSVDADLPRLGRFAALVAAAEREACAKLVESLPLEWGDQPNIAQAELATMMDCALAIRARGQA